MTDSEAKKPNRNGKPPDNKVSFSTIAMGVGILLVVFGLWQLAERLFGSLFEDIWRIISLVISILWPIVIIAGGVALVLMARKGNLSLPTDRKLFRSVRNRKLGGICGGIAEYLSADPVAVRVITIVLAVLCWYVIVPLYILSWIIIEPDTKNYNNWV